MGHTALTFEGFCDALGDRMELTLPSDLGRSLTDDLEIDSLRLFEMIVVVEGIAYLEVPPEDLPELLTLGDAYTYYRQCLELAVGRR